MKNESTMSSGMTASTLFTWNDEENVCMENKNYLFLEKPQYNKMPAYQIGDMILKRYEVIDLFSGKMGQVYACLDHKYDRKVAIKTIIHYRMKDKKAFDSFMEEAFHCMKLKKCNHVIKIRQIEIIEGYPFIVSEWVEGDPIWGNSLEQWFNKQYLFTPYEIVDFIHQICEGMIYCAIHLSSENTPFVLGDLKPANILVTKDHIFKISDFGTHVKTEEYESPEQKSHKNLDERSDIFSLGLIAQRMVKNVKTDTEDEHEQSCLLQLKEIIEKCLEKDLNKRISSFRLLKQSIDSLYQKADGYPQKSIDYRPTMKEWVEEKYSKINMGEKVESDIFHTINPLFVKMDLYDFIDLTKGDELNYYNGEAARKRGNFDEAIKYYKTAMSSENRGSGRILVGMGQTLQSMGKHTEALKQFRAAIQKEQYLPAMECESELMLLHRTILNETETNEIYKRIHILEQRIAKGCRSRQLLILLGKYYHILMKYEKASFYYQESLQYYSTEEWLYIYRYGECEYYQMNVTKALGIFNVAVSSILEDKNYPENSLKITTLLNCYYFLRDDRNFLQTLYVAEELYHIRFQYKSLEDGIQKDSEDYRQYTIEMDKISACEKKKQAEGFRQLYDKLVSPENKYSFRFISDLSKMLCSRETAACCEIENYTEGLRSCNRALMYDKVNPDILQNKGFCYLKMNDIKSALTCFNTAITYELDTRKRNILIKARDDLFQQLQVTM